MFVYASDEWSKAEHENEIETLVKRYLTKKSHL